MLATMGDDTRKLLKVFGIAVTDFEAQVDRLMAAAAAVGTGAGTGAGKDEVQTLVAETSRLSRELGQRWLEVTQHVFAMQDRFLGAVGEAAARAKS
jgi:hypothetical protein